jgi:uncharacterized protein YuzE
MIAEVLVKKEVEITTLEVNAGVRYWEDGEVNGVEDTNGDLIPCVKNGRWCPIIDVDSGIITNWKQGVTANVHYKVCDDGSYYLKDKDDNVVLSIESDYVPDTLCIEEQGYGDYIIMSIDENGKIVGWDFSLSGFQNEDND